MRNLRPYLPGGTFHITARIQGREPLLEPIRDDVCELINFCFGRTNAMLIARTVMPNHLHLVLRQGSDPLHATMQPLLRRIAYLVHRTHGLEGHVFGGPYTHRTCGDARYLRNCIVYTHLNPVRAGIVDNPGQYRWSSHAAYLDTAIDLPGYMTGLGLFATSEARSIAALQDDYRKYISWRMARDSFDSCIAAGIAADEPPTPSMWAGDVYWQAEMGGAQHTPPDPRDEKRMCDLRDFIHMMLTARASDLEVGEICGNYRTRPIVEIRKFVVERALDAGFRNHEIARFLKISPSTISRINYNRFTKAGAAAE